MAMKACLRFGRLFPLLLIVAAWFLLADCAAGATPGASTPLQRRSVAIAARLRSAIAARAGKSTSPGQLLQQCPPEVRGTCFTPAQVRAAYGVDQLAAQGIDGTGQSVVVIVSFGSPTVQQDVAAFDRATGLPDAQVDEEYPLGQDFSNAGGCPGNDRQGWAEETTLDVEWIHAIAPGARIIVLASPVSETEGVTGMPEFLALERYARDNALGSIISQSWGTSEDLLADDAGAALRARFDAFYADATQSDLTIFSASGDSGLLGDTPDCGVSSSVSAGWPATEPDVTSVGGTVLSLNPDGSYGSERVLQSAGLAGGSGISAFYAEPQAQSLLPDAVQQQLQGMRGEPDVSAVGAGLLVYASGSDAQGPSPRAIGGTSASTPIWAGIAALAAQAAGGPLGNINPALYAIGASGRCFHDVTAGANTFHGNSGEAAGPGWDLATGWGSPDASCLVPMLAAMVTGG